MKYILLLSLFLINTNLLSAEKKVIRLSSLDWEPYIGKDIPENGYVAQLVKEAFKTQGHETIIEYYPWSRALSTAKEGVISDGLVPEYISEEGKQDFLFSDPFKGGPVGFFARVEDSIKFSGKLKELKELKIGVVRGYVNTAEFDNASFLKKHEATSDLLNLKMLLAKRVDLIVIDKYVAGYLLKKHFDSKQRSKLVFISPALEEKDLYIAFSKKNKNHKKFRDVFNKGLKEIENRIPIIMGNLK